MKISSLSILELIAAMLAFLVAETAAFQLPLEGRPSPRLPRPTSSAESDWSLCESPEPRRAFFVDLLSKGAMFAGVCSTLPQPAAAEDLVSTGAIKVTAIAHTFVTTGKAPSPKPIRENDATRFFTNAKVVYIFEGSSSSDNLKLAQEVTELTRQRKAEQGPGVTPGNLLERQRNSVNDTSVENSYFRGDKLLEELRLAKERGFLFARKFKSTDQNSLDLIELIKTSIHNH